MRPQIFPFTVFLFALSTLSSQDLQPKTDSVITLTEKMLESLGGKELWRNTISLHIKERMWPKQLADVVNQEIWRDLTKPGTKIHLISKTMNRIRAWDADQGWGILENGKSYVFDSIRVKSEVKAWKSNLFTICHKIANNDSEIIIKEKKGDIIEILDKSQNAICTIELNARGAPIKWWAQMGEEIESYVYGPLKQFGKYNLPSWWTSPDGHWQFEYVEFDGSSTMAKIFFLPPSGFKINK